MGPSSMRLLPFSGNKDIRCSSESPIKAPQFTTVIVSQMRRCSRYSFHSKVRIMASRPPRLLPIQRADGDESRCWLEGRYSPGSCWMELGTLHHYSIHIADWVDGNEPAKRYTSLRD